MTTSTITQAIEASAATYRSARNIVLNGALVVISCTFALGVGETYFRVFDPQSIIPRYVETSPFGIRKNIAHVRGNMIVPEYQHEFSTNSQGFRGTQEYATAKPLGVYRIVVLGDSTTLGHGVGDEETFSFLLQQHLSQKRSTEVINMSVSGFGTAEELIQLRQVGLQYNPDLVILGYFPNDPYNNTVSKLFKLDQGKLVQDQQAFVPAIYVRDRLYDIPGWSFLCQHSHVVNLIRNRFSGFFIKRLGDQNSVPSETTRTLSQTEAELTASLLNAIADELHQRRLPLIILNIPLIKDGEVIHNLPVDLINQQSPELHLIDVQEKIYTSHSPTDISYAKDSHPTRFAHKLIAEWLARYIQEQIWPDASLQSPPRPWL